MVDLESPVTLILDGTYALRAIKDAKLGPVWLVNSPKNTKAAKELWSKFEGRGDYITVFDSHGESVEDACLDVIPTIDLHHPEFSELIVVGVNVTPRMRTVLGHRINRETDDGFVLAQSNDPFNERKS